MKMRKISAESDIGNQISFSLVYVLRTSRLATTIFYQQGFTLHYDLSKFTSLLFFSFEYPLIPLDLANFFSSGSFISSSLSKSVSVPSVIGNASLLSSRDLPLGAVRDGIGDIFTNLDGGRVNLKSLSGGLPCTPCSFLGTPLLLLVNTLPPSLFVAFPGTDRESVNKRYVGIGSYF